MIRVLLGKVGVPSSEWGQIERGWANGFRGDVGHLLTRGARPVQRWRDVARTGCWVQRASYLKLWRDKIDAYVGFGQNTLPISMQLKRFSLQTYETKTTSWNFNIPLLSWNMGTLEIKNAKVFFFQFFWWNCLHLWNIRNLADGFRFIFLRANPLRFHRYWCSTLVIINLGIDFVPSQFIIRSLL